MYCFSHWHWMYNEVWGCAEILPRRALRNLQWETFPKLSMHIEPTNAEDQKNVNLSLMVYVVAGYMPHSAAIRCKLTHPFNSIFFLFLMKGEVELQTLCTSRILYIRTLLLTQNWLTRARSNFPWIWPHFYQQTRTRLTRSPCWQQLILHSLSSNLTS